MTQMSPLAHQRTAGKRERRISAITSPTPVASTMATTEMTMVSISPSTNGPLGVTRLFQKNSQSKCIRTVRSLLDAQVRLPPLRQDLVIAAVCLELVHCILNRIVQHCVSLQRCGTDLDGAEGLPGHLDLRTGLRRVITQRLSGVEVGIH